MRRELRAGPLRVVFADGELRGIYLGGVEALQRVYAAVRDHNWDTVPGRIENLSVEERPLGFAISYDSVHTEGPVDFRWRAAIEGDESGAISFAFDGRAHSTFMRNRIGLCVHHPMSCASRKVVIRHNDSSLERAVFPDLISPHQPFKNISGIRHEPVTGVRVEVRFTGEIFEMEDHRNWTDAGFKTYGTPLAIPIPVEVREGTEVHQRIDIRLEGAAEQRSSAGERAGAVVRISETRAGRLPALGTALPAGGAVPSEAELAALRPLRFAHIRAELRDDGDAATAARMREALAGPDGERPLLEAAITWPHFPSNAAALRGSVARWLVFDAHSLATTPEALAAAREALGKDAVLAYGSNRYFAELNRNRPQTGGFEACCFPITPQVHVFDDEAVMGNTAAQPETLRTTASFAPGKAVAITPVTLKPRHFPPPDPRQRMQFCAAWTLASLKRLAEGGAASITYFETHGQGGLVDGESRYPVYRVFEALAPFKGAELLQAESSLPRCVVALAVVRGSSRRVIVANLTDQEQDVAVELPSELRPLRLGPYWVEVVD